MIIGFSITELEAKSQNEPAGRISVNYSSKIDKVEEEEVAIYNDKVARIHFSFNIAYQDEKAKDRGNISYKGFVLWKGDLMEIQKTWKKSDLPENVKGAVLSHIYSKCLVKSVGVADSLGMPTPVPMPRFELKKD